MFFCLSVSAQAQDAAQDSAMKNCPMHKQHAMDDHHATVERHGEQAMGFSQKSTTHHFRMTVDGGAIEVTANDPTDKTSTEAIRSHLTHIAVMFKNGDFSTPMFVHDELPPGVTTMKLLKSNIGYDYEEIASGGRVHIKSDDPVAIAAIHDFLRFQISEHRTGDSLEVENIH
jgi:hypothetical protein